MTVATEPELITLAEAADRFNRNEATMRHWVHRGILLERGRLPTPGARPRILVDANDVQLLIEHPPRPGPVCKL